MVASTPVINAFTVDVEDYFHVTAFAQSVKRDGWKDYPSRVVSNTHRVLRLLDQHSVRGTFFILGWVAEHFPRLVQDIQKSGHEVGCHSYAHRLTYDLTPEEFRDDLRRSTQILEDILGSPVTAYRAPSFSITARSEWAIDILVEEGYTHDSSIFPVHHDCYGMPDAERFPHRIVRGARHLYEFPPTVHRWMRWNVPVAGGGYFRLYPLKLSLKWLGNVNTLHAQPCMFYIHPWELDPEQPRLPGPLKSRFRHYQNLHSTERKLASLMQHLTFGTMSEALADRELRSKASGGSVVSATGSGVKADVVVRTAS